MQVNANRQITRRARAYELITQTLITGTLLHATDAPLEIFWYKLLENVMTKDEQKAIMMLGKMQAVDTLMTEILASINADTDNDLWTMVMTARADMIKATGFHWNNMDQLIEE